MDCGRFPSSHEWTLCVTHKSPKGWLKTRIDTFGVAFHFFVASNRRHFKFNMWVDHSKSQPTDDKPSLKWGWSRHLTHFYPRSASNARVIAIIVCLSVCVCVSHAGIVSKRLNVGSRKQRHVTARDSSFLTPKFVGGWPPLPPEICAKSDPPLFKQHNFDKYLLLAPQPWELAKKVKLALIGSRPGAFQRAIGEPCTLPLTPPKGGTKRDFAISFQ